MIDFTFILIAFAAGILTVLTPCVLPLLPVIIGGSFLDNNKWRPLLITLALAISIVAFTLFLKVSAVFIKIPQDTWKYISGGIILIFGIVTLFPDFWSYIAVKLKISSGSDNLLIKANSNKSTFGALLLGAALGPVFSSCSPTYFIILATILPANFFSGIIYLLIYAIGISLTFFAIIYFGKKLTSRLKFIVNPNGVFKKVLGILMILVGLAIITGVEKKIETALLNAGYGATRLEQELVKNLEQVNSKEFKEEDLNLLPNLGKAPEFTGLENWINTDKPLSLETLKGKVVLVDFWTYSCINCINTLPYLKDWYAKYAKDGLVIVGVHAPEFQFEKILKNVEKAAKDYGLEYPIVQDNDFKTWRAYDNHYWPAKYLIDQDGNLRYYHFGEGKYAEAEKAIAGLLKVNDDLVKNEVTKNINSDRTRETYMGLGRRSNYIEEATSLKTDEWTLNGKWQEEEEKITVLEENSLIRFKFKATTANLVMSGKGTAEVYVDSKLLTENNGKDVINGILKIDGDRLYELTNFEEYQEKEIEIKFKDAGVSLYAWTFE